VKNELLVLPHDPNWNEARLAWNLSADQQPAAVALPESAEDVVAVVRWARQRGLRVAQKRERGERLFGELTYRRLQTVKAAVDPDDVFRSNHPVRLPAAEAKRAA
jgi:FAD/FMN-containing dehydrogenase